MNVIFFKKKNNIRLPIPELRSKIFPLLLFFVRYKFFPSYEHTLSRYDGGRSRRTH